MKIALLNLPFDNNYGGNLQRYALIRVLEGMGHEVVHVDLESYFYLKWHVKPYSYAKRFIQKYLLKRNVHVCLEEYINKQNEKKNKYAKVFYESYINHTERVTKKEEIIRIVNKGFDVVIVGSDQVWRESMTKQIGIDSYFLSVVRSNSIKRIAYAVSMGVENISFSPKNLSKLGRLYSNFDAVSVREQYAIERLKKYGWTNPKAKWVLDPTFLLESIDYNKLVDISGIIKSEKEYAFCYILDKPKDFDDRITDICKRWRTYYYIQTLSDIRPIEEWIANIMNAKVVVTDSYHGCVFSIIFKRPFVFLGNERRGNARLQSLFNMLSIDESETEKIDYTKVDAVLKKMKEYSIQFLLTSLS